MVEGACSQAWPVVILGAGGHGRTLASTLLDLNRSVLGYLDANPECWGTQLFGIPVLGDDAKLETYSPTQIRVVNGVGSVDTPQRRRAVYEQQLARGFTFETIVHPSAHVSPRASLGAGAQVLAGAIVQAGAKVGANVIVNTGAIVEHDCTLGAHCHVAPGAVISGGTQLGASCHIGAGAVLLQGIALGELSTVGAGAVVTRSHGPQSRLVGVPARSMG